MYASHDYCFRAFTGMIQQTFYFHHALYHMYIRFQHFFPSTGCTTARRYHVCICPHEWCSKKAYQAQRLSLARSPPRKTRQNLNMVTSDLTRSCVRCACVCVCLCMYNIVPPIPHTGFRECRWSSMGPGGIRFDDGPRCRHWVL